MSELLSKEQFAEIEHRKPYQYGTMVRLTVAERDALCAQLHEVGAERDMYLEQRDASREREEESTREYQADINNAISNFRQRAIGAVRLKDWLEEDIEEVVTLLQSLPAISSEVGRATHDSKS